MTPPFAGLSFVRTVRTTTCTARSGTALVRPAPRGDRPLRRGCRRRRSGEARTGERPSGRGAKRRPFVPRLLGRGRRADDRPLADEGRASIPTHAPRACGRPARGARPGDAGVRASPCRRHRHAHRRRRGLTLGGGIGWIMRKHGLSVDQLVSVDLVTAEESSSRRAPTRTGRSLLGLEGRRRQLRDRHGVRVPLRATRYAGPGRADLLADGEVRRGPALLSRLSRTRLTS